MNGYWYSLMPENELSFVMKTYDENIEALHGIHRNYETWKALIADAASAYYVVYKEEPVAWFRLDIENGEVWLGMLQVNQKYHRQGIGKYILRVAEELAREKGYYQLGVHTTEDNIAARNLYLSCGYQVTEYGPCTTADGKVRTGYTFQKKI